LTPPAAMVVTTASWNTSMANCSPLNDSVSTPSNGTVNVIEAVMIGVGVGYSVGTSVVGNEVGTAVGAAVGT